MIKTAVEFKFNVVVGAGGIVFNIFSHFMDQSVKWQNIGQINR